MRSGMIVTLSRKFKAWISWENVDWSLSLEIRDWKCAFYLLRFIALLLFEFG